MGSTKKFSNRLPTLGDVVLRYNYRKHEHEDAPTGVIESQADVAEGGGFYVYLKDQSVIVVENYDPIRKEWIERRPRMVDSANLVRPKETK